MRRSPSKEPPRTIRAGEIGEYSYCSRAWWYRHVIKLTPPGDGPSDRFTKGIEAHHRHGRRVATASALGSIGLALALLGILIVAAALLLR